MSYVGFKSHQLMVIVGLYSLTLSFCIFCLKREKKKKRSWEFSVIVGIISVNASSRRRLKGHFEMFREIFVPYAIGRPSEIGCSDT